MKFFVLFCQIIITLASGCLLHSSAMANEEPVDGAPSLYVDDTDNTSVEAIINESNSDIDDNILSSNSSNSNNKVDSSKEENKNKEDSNSDNSNIPPMNITEMVEAVAKNKNTANVADTISDQNTENSTTNNTVPNNTTKKKGGVGANSDSQPVVDTKTADVNIDKKIDTDSKADNSNVVNDSVAANVSNATKVTNINKDVVESAKESNDIASHNNNNVENNVENTVENTASDVSQNQINAHGIEQNNQSSNQVTVQSVGQNAKNENLSVAQSAGSSANITEANTNQQTNANNQSSVTEANSLNTTVSANASDNNSGASTQDSIQASTDNSSTKDQKVNSVNSAVDSVASSVEQNPKKQGQAEVTSQNTSVANQSPIGVTDTVNQSLTAIYTREYLQNMYLPLFYNTYELPQSLNSYVTLRNVKVAEKGISLVYEIGVAEQYGPMDLEGTPRNNKLMKLFCKIAINDGILHRIDGIDLVFFHDDKDFFEKNLDYNECTGFDITQVDDSILEKENQRLSEEFVYAYKLEQGHRLSHDYLVNKFAPFALTLINEKFADLEQNKTMSVENDSNLVITFYIDEKDVANIQKNEYITDRINRICNIDSYSKWVLPRIDNLIYRYVLTNDRTEQGIRKEIIVDAKTCSSLSNTSLIN